MDGEITLLVFFGLIWSLSWSFLDGRIGWIDDDINILHKHNTIYLFFVSNFLVFNSLG